ncbi:hypothetical protein BH708_15190 [Brachybacterium sp. P6-10-X1]|uniref:hypothetical protein n=1 Tax=Brachybacterium sp. P6-10-X1 TaxID=1903186 RepID=UPI000971BA1A|nr:hypothetical protein [Brachybacterium sp. P6-10-X1]APX33832.1 hypothetical protein BH708_15190 [Brachybacterium sp. P6-10-X1]
MKPISALRGRLSAVPTAVRRRSRDAATRARILADARAIGPEIPRDADPDDLIRAARRLVRRAAQDEFAREGVTRVRLPEEISRAELRRADVAGDASFHAVVEDVLSALDIVPSPLEREDAVDLRRAPTSADRYGLSPEVAADLASYVLQRAVELDGELEDGEVEDVEQFFTVQATRIREDVRAVLVRQVTVPLELKVALERHERIETGEPDAERFTSPVRGPGAAGATDEERQGFARRARAAYDFAQSEAGRTAFGVLRTGAEKAYEKYGKGEGRSGGTDSGSGAKR